MHTLLLLKNAFMASLVILSWAILNPIGLIILAIALFCIVLLLRAENKHVRKLPANTRYSIINHLFRIAYILLCFFSIPWGLLSWASALAAHISMFYYKVNLIAVGAFIPLVLIINWYSRRLENANKMQRAFFVLLIPMIDIFISMISITMI